MIRYSLSIALFALVASITFAAAPDTSWTRIGDDYNRDISALIKLGETSEGPVFLVAHDNKYQYEDRIAKVTFKGDSTIYRPFSWPQGVEKLVDIEAMTFAPDHHGLYVTTSKGKAAFLEIDFVNGIITKVHPFTLPTPDLGRPQIEGFQVIDVRGTEWAVWGDRGSDERPGMLFWASFNPETLVMGKVRKHPLSVPWPTLSEVRHISDLRIDANGQLYISSASEASNDGPFDSALYHVGMLFYPPTGDGPSSKLPPVLDLDDFVEPVEIARFPGHKVEGFDLLPDGGYAVGTDDENLGSFIRQVR